MVNKIKVATPTKEQIEYEDAKKNFRVATAKARLHSAGIDPSKISQQAIDKVMRIFDDMDHIQQDAQQNTSKLQRDTDIAIQKINQDANKKFGDIQKKYQDLVNSLRGDKKEEMLQIDSPVQIQADVQEESPKGEIRKETREDRIAKMTEILLQAMRVQINEKVNEIMLTIDKKVDDIVTQNSDKVDDIVIQTDVQKN